MGFMDKLVSGKELIGVKKRRSQSYIFEKFEYELQEKLRKRGVDCRQGTKVDGSYETSQAFR